MKKLLGIVVLGLLLSGCAESGAEVLSSLIYGVALLGLMLMGVIIYPIVKTVSVVTKVLYPDETPNQTKERRKKYLKEISKQISDDRKFVKRNYIQYKNNHQRKYPKSKYPNADSYLSHSGWINEVAKVKYRIKSRKV